MCVCADAQLEGVALTCISTATVSRDTDDIDLVRQLVKRSYTRIPLAALEYFIELAKMRGRRRIVESKNISAAQQSPWLTRLPGSPDRRGSPSGIAEAMPLGAPSRDKKKERDSSGGGGR